METNSQTEHQGSEILNELLKTVNKSQDIKPKPMTTEVRQLFIGNLPFRVRWQDTKDLFRKAGHVVRADVALNYENRSKGHGTVLFTSVEDAQKAIDMFNGYKWQGRILEVRGDRGFVENSKSHIEEPSSPPPVQHDKKLVSPSSSKASSPAVEVKKEILVEKENKPKDIEEEENVVEGEKKREKKGKEPKIKKDKKEKKEVEYEEGGEDGDCKQLFVGNLPFNCQWQDLKDLFRNSGRILRADVVLNFEGRSRGFGTVLFSSHEDAKSAIEQYNGFELNGRILRVHFDKFAASHAKFREDEANTFGQRQIHDPESLALLRQTYLPPQQSMLPPLPYGLSTLIPSQVPHHYYNTNTTPTTTTATTTPQANYSPLTTQQQMPFTNMYPTSYNPSGMYNPINNFGYLHNNNSTSINTNLYNAPMYGYQTQYWMQPSYQTDNDLTNSINNLSLQNNTTTTTDSAGLNKKDWY